jgi:signal transduction histidine kinase
MALDGTTETVRGAARADRSSLQDALDGVRDDLGFDTASLFVSAPAGWRLLERRGPTRPWHVVLDPSALEGTPETAEYTDARTIPGVGPRLAKLGCASVATLPLPDGGRLLLDSSTSGRVGGWVERARPYLQLMSLMSGPQWPGGGALRSHDEVAGLQRIFDACQSVIARQGSTFEELLVEVREAIHADELFLITERGGELTALASTPDGSAPRLPRKIQDGLQVRASSALTEEHVRQLAVSLGIASRAVAAAYGRDADAVEILIAGWADGPALSPVSMTFAARAVSTVRAGLAARREAVKPLDKWQRIRVAGALHDDLTQVVTGAVLELQGLRKAIDQDPGAAVATVESSEAEIRRALSALRDMIRHLESGVAGPGHAEPENIGRFLEDVAKRWKLPMPELSVEGDLGEIPSEIRSIAYDVVREALTNAAKHAGGSKVTVSLAVRATDLTIVVGDHGRGFTRNDKLSAQDDNHFGLGFLRRKVKEAGGHLQVQSRPGVGTRVTAQLPLHEVAS